jgi:beta-N-acetylhexosaminidase
MIDVSGLTLTEAEKNQLINPNVGGIILFTRNFETRTQIKTLISEIRKFNSNLLIAVDHEGGRVQRFRQEFTQLPSMASLGKVYDESPQKALKQAFSCGFVLAYELLEIGVDFSFAPVLDVDYQNSKVIGDRAFHSNAKVVIALAGSLIDGMHLAGMKCVGKHFPGHGFVQADSHVDLPVDKRTKAELNVDIAVFSQLSTQLDAIMPAHIVYSALDVLPAGFSTCWFEILRQEVKFKGVVFSDDLSMQGAEIIGDIEARVSTALKCGCNMVLICNHPELVTQVIDKVWGTSEKLHSMRGNFQEKLDKIEHLETIRALL